VFAHLAPGYKAVPNRQLGHPGWPSSMSAEKGGALRTVSAGGRRVLVAVPLCGALLAVPFLALRAGSSARPDHTALARSNVATAASFALPLAGAVQAPAWQLAAYTVKAPAPPVQATPAAPPPSSAPAPSVASVPRPVAAAVIAHAAPVPAPTPSTTVAPGHLTVQRQNARSGQATWYSQAVPGYCASPDLPFGTVLTVTNQANGASTTCVVNDREGNTPGRIVDLSYQGFAQIADPSEGIIAVTITW
jgi:hypothetical protein